jgi:hypothetical protein
MHRSLEYSIRSLYVIPFLDKLMGREMTHASPKMSMLMLTERNISSHPPVWSLCKKIFD